MKGRPQLFVKDLAKPTSPAITFSPPQLSGTRGLATETMLWGDWVTFSVWDDTKREESIYFYNYVTGCPAGEVQEWTTA